MSYFEVLGVKILHVDWEAHNSPNNTSNRTWCNVYPSQVWPIRTSVLYVLFSHLSLGYQAPCEIHMLKDLKTPNDVWVRIPNATPSLYRLESVREKDLLC